MKEIIKIGNQEVQLSNNVAWTMEYRDQFGKDIIPAIMPVIASALEAVSTVVAQTRKTTDISVADIMESLEGRSMEILLPLFQVEFVDTIINITWAMAKAADESILPPKQWVKSFDEFPLDEIGPKLFDLITKGFVSRKNLNRLKSIKNDLRTLQPSHSTTSSSQDSKED